MTSSVAGTGWCALLFSMIWDMIWSRASKQEDWTSCDRSDHQREHFTLLVEDVVSPPPVFRVTTMWHTAAWRKHAPKQLGQRIDPMPGATHEPKEVLCKHWSCDVRAVLLGTVGVPWWSKSGPPSDDMQCGYRNKTLL